MRQPAFLQHANSRECFGGAPKGVYNATEQSSPQPSSGYSSTDESAPSCSFRSFPAEAAEHNRSSRKRRQSARSLLTLSLSEALALTMGESPAQSDCESCAESHKEETKPDIETDYNWNTLAMISHEDGDDKTSERNWESDVGCYLSPLSELSTSSCPVPTKYSSADVLETSLEMLETLSASETDFNPRHSDELLDENPQPHLFTDIAQEPHQQSPAGCLLGCNNNCYIKKVNNARSGHFRFRRDAVTMNRNYTPLSTKMPVLFNEGECNLFEEAFQSETLERYFEKANSFKAIGIQNITCDETSAPFVTVCGDSSSKVTDSDTGVDMTRLDSSHEDLDDSIVTCSGDFNSNSRKGSAGEISQREASVEPRLSEESAFESNKTDFSNVLVSNGVHLQRNLKPCHLLDENDFPRSERSYSPATCDTDDEFLKLTEDDFDFPSIKSQDIALDSTDCILGGIEETYERNISNSGKATSLSPAFDCRDSRLLSNPTPSKRQKFRHRRNSKKSQRDPSVVRIALLDHGYCLKTARIPKNSRKDNRRSNRLIDDLSLEYDRCKGNLSSVLARLLITRERLHPNEGSDWFLHMNVDTKLSDTKSTVDERKKKELSRESLKLGHEVSSRDELSVGDRLENINGKQTLALDYDSHESGFHMEDVDLEYLELENFDELWNNCFDPMKFTFSSLP